MLTPCDRAFIAHLIQRERREAERAHNIAIYESFIEVASSRPSNGRGSKMEPSMPTFARLRVVCRLCGKPHSSHDFDHMYQSPLTRRWVFYWLRNVQQRKPQWLPAEMNTTRMARTYKGWRRPRTTPNELHAMVDAIEHIEPGYARIWLAGGLACAGTNAKIAALRSRK